MSSVFCYLGLFINFLVADFLNRKIPSDVDQSILIPLIKRKKWIILPWNFMQSLLMAKFRMVPCPWLQSILLPALSINLTKQNIS